MCVRQHVPLRCSGDAAADGPDGASDMAGESGGELAGAADDSIGLVTLGCVKLGELLGSTADGVDPDADIDGALGTGTSGCGCGAATDSDRVRVIAGATAGVGVTAAAAAAE